MRNFGLIGKSLAHSFSESFFTEKFQREMIDARYANYELESIEKFPDLIANHHFSGLNVTIPFKESILPFLDELSPEAEAIGAVNVVAFENGRLKGYNTDAFGFHQSIKPFLTNQHERVLIFGTGGAAKAVAHVFRTIGLGIFFVSRNPQFDNELSYEAINEHVINACKVIVNCTPLGTFPKTEESISLPFSQLTTDHLCIDLVYNPEKTLFLTRAEAEAATILNGTSMLHEQALKAWTIWNKSL
jgi:shikimate dehydrogenase